MKLVFIDNLVSGMVAAQDIYPPNNSAASYVRKNTVLTNTMISEMRRLNIRFAYIQDRPSQVVSPGRAAGDTEAAARLPVIPRPQPVINHQLRNSAVGTLQDLYQAVDLRAGEIHDSARIVRQLDSVVDQLVDSIAGKSGMLVNINDLKSYDDYTFHHSLSVSVLAIAIGQHLGFNREQLHHLGTCGMMHDIGKTTIPIEIINKPGKLSDTEFAVIKTHSPAGSDYLVRSGVGDEEMWRGVHAHHERFDGAGYPNGLKGAEIPLFSRILSVADVYDALTSNRPYRTPMQPAEAVEYVMGGAGTAFDYDIVTAFLKRVELYPVGCRLRLTGGKVGTVLSNENQFRPVVRLDNGEIYDLYRDKSCRNIVVEQLVET